MKKRKSATIVLSVFGILAMAFIFMALTYRIVKRNGIIEHQVVNKDLNAGPKVLFITQDRPFKRAIVDHIVKFAQTEHFTLEVIDVTQADFMNLDSWNHVILLGTVQSSDLNPEIQSFLSTHFDPESVTLLITADSGEWKNAKIGIDALTAASKMENVPMFVSKIQSELAQVLRTD